MPAHDNPFVVHASACPMVYFSNSPKAEELHTRPLCAISVAGLHRIPAHERDGGVEPNVVGGGVDNEYL